MFSCCHPRLHEDVQVALVLHLLCGLGVDEIASAFLGRRAAIEKRLTRGKKTLAESKRLFDLTAGGLRAAALGRAARALSPLQRGLPRRERRGGRSDRSLPRGDAPRAPPRRSRAGRDAGDLRARRPDVARRRQAAGRIGEDGKLRALFAQDRSRWDGDLVAEGMKLLGQSAAGDELTGVPRRGGDRGDPRRGRQHEGDPLGGDRRALRRAHEDPPVAGRRLNRAIAHRRARRAGARARGDRRDRRRRASRNLPLLSGRPGRARAPHRANRRGEGALPCGEAARAQRRRTTLPRGAHRGVRSETALVMAAKGAADCDQCFAVCVRSRSRSDACRDGRTQEATTGA